MTTVPLTSVVLLNYNGGEDTLRCMEALAQLDWPSDRLEVVVVDNASTDGSADAIAEAIGKLPCEGRLVRLRRNTGFAGGCNAGVDAARGDLLAFLNNDARPDPRWLAEGAPVLQRHRDVACVASKVLSWEGDRVDYVGRAGITFYGFGYRELFGQPYAPSDSEDEADVVFATGSAMIVKAEAYRDVGGFDDRFFAFFEDVDLGWRLWLLGWRVRYVPTSVVFHHHHGTMRRFGPWREDFLLERNALYTMIKNFDDERLARTLPAALLLSARRGVIKGQDDTSALDLARGAAGDEPRTITLNRETVAPLFAMDAVMTNLPDLLASRADIQTRRRRSDTEIFRMVGDPFLLNRGERSFTEPAAALREQLDLDDMFGSRHRVAVVTGDPLHERMSGPGIRAWEMARVLARTHDVRLVSTQSASLTSEAFEVLEGTGRTLAAVERWCDVLVFQGYLLQEHPSLVRSRKVLVADLYDPFHLEQLELTKEMPPAERRAHTQMGVKVINDQVRRADFFICASPKQRDFWLGQLAAVGRVNELTYAEDPNLNSLIAVVPFGVPEVPPRAVAPAIKGVVPGIAEDDVVVLWGGGLYSWFDAETVVDAVAIARDRCPRLRLFFMGGRHPNPNVPPMQAAIDARRRAEDAGVLDKQVFFNTDWVPYERRQDYLVDADIGVSAHHEHLETAFSFRTRILDYIWAGLPIVTTAGDAMAELVAQKGLGRVIAPGDAEGMAVALVELAEDREEAAAIRTRLSEVAETMRWDHVLAPLLDFAARPRRAPDLVAGLGDADPGGGRGRGAESRRLMTALRTRLKAEGPAATAAAAVAYARRRFR